MKNIGFLASHNGSAAKAISIACQSGRLNATPKILISNNNASNAILWAKDLGLQTCIVNAKSTNDVDGEIASLFLKNSVDIVVCSGYMKLVGSKTISSVEGRILNVHPALLPLYGGHGMYGRHVHQAVFDNKDIQTGITIHLVDGEYDKGRIIGQKIIALDKTDDVDSIEQKVKLAEPEFYIEVLEKIIISNIIL